MECPLCCNGHNYLVIIVGLVFWLISFSLAAQQYPRKKFTIRDGLPQSQVLKVVQHSDGHIWLSTKGGIAKFDGKVFESFGTQEGFHPEQYRQLCFSGDTTLFLGIQRGVAQWFHLPSKRFIPSKPRTREGKSQNWKVIQDLSGHVLLADRVQLDSTSGVISILQDSVVAPSIAHSSLRGKITEISDWRFNKADSALWICDHNGILFRIKNGESRFIHKFEKHGENLEIQFLEGANDEFLAFVTDERTIYELEVNSVSKYKKLPWDKTVAPTPRRGQLVIDKYNNFFLLVDETAVWALFDGQLKWTLIDEFNLVSQLFIDRENNLYVADEGALYVYNNFAFCHFTPEKDGIPRYIWSVVEDDMSRLWLGSYGDGLWIWDPKNSQTIDLSHEGGSSGRYHLFEWIYMGAIKVASGDLIIPASGYVCAFEQNGSLKKRLNTDGHSALILWEDKVRNEVYAGTTGGVYIYDKQYNQIGHLNDSLLLQRPVVSIGKDARGHLWMGTWDNIYKYDGKRVTVPFNNYGDISARCIYHDHHGNMWFGGHEGLYCYDGRSLIEVAEELFRGSVSSLTEIDENRLLVGLADGVAVVDLPQYSSRQANWYAYYGEELGFTGIEPGQNGAIRAHDGSLWVATTDKLTMLNPKLLKPQNENQISIQISSVQRIESDMTGEGQVIDIELVENDKKILVPYSSNRLRINFKAINHTSPLDIEYKYRLVGFDDDWSPGYTERFAEYTNLSPDEYTFEVRAQHKNQPALGEPVLATFSFTVPAPFYLTWWFFLIVVLTAAMAVSYSTILIVRRHRARLEQENLLSLEMSQLQYRALKTQVEPHFASNLLNSVNAAILKEDKLQASRVLSHFARLIRKILQHNERMVYTLQEELDFIEEYVKLEQISLKGRLKYKTNIAGDVDLHRAIPVMLLHTFVENSIKHALRPNRNGGEIHLSIHVDHVGDHIEIRDTGRGPKVEAPYATGSGKGVVLVQRIIEIHNQRNKRKVTLDIEDSAEGRRVLIFIPKSFTFVSLEPS